VALAGPQRCIWWPGGWHGGKARRRSQEVHRSAAADVADAPSPASAKCARWSRSRPARRRGLPPRGSPLAPRCSASVKTSVLASDRGSNHPGPSWMTMTLSSPRRYLTARRVLSFLSISLPSLSRTAPQATRSRSSSTSLLPCDSFGRSRGRLSCFVSHPLRVRHRAHAAAKTEGCKGADRNPAELPCGRGETSLAAFRAHAARRGPLLVDRPRTGLHQEASTRSRVVPCPVENMSPRRLSDRLPRRHFSHRRGDAGRSIGKAVIRPVAAAIGDAESGSYSLRGAAASSPGALARPPRTAPPG
jgi:hypothetical protein